MPHSTGKQTRVKRSSTGREWSLDGRESDLDWALRVPHAKTYRQQQSADFKFGNFEKRKYATEVFSRYASMHGISVLLSDEKKLSSFHCVGCFYKLVFISCIILMTASLVFLCQEAFRKESVYISSTSKESSTGFDDDRFFPEYPKITICQMPSYIRADDSSEQELLEYAFLALGYPFVALSLDQSSVLVESAFFKATGRKLLPEMQNLTDRLQLQQERYEKLKGSVVDFNITEYIVNNSVKCQEIFVSCIAFIFHLPCCKIFQPTLTNLGNCYSLTFDKQLREIEQQSREIDFALVLDFHAVEDNGKPNALGYMVFLSDPKSYENFFQVQDGYPVTNGFTTKTSRKALFTPWHGLWSACPNMPEDLNTGNEEEGYTKTNCIRRYMDGAIQKACGCSFQTGRSNNLPKCDPNVMYECYLYAIAKDNLTGLTQKCIDSCFEYKYESYLTAFKIGGGDNRSRLMFMYDSTQYNLHEYKKTTMSSFLSQIGGVMGLYVGASVITVVETLCYLAACTYYRFLPQKTVRASRQSSKVSPRKAIRNKNDYFY